MSTKVHSPKNRTTYIKVTETGNLMALLSQPTTCGQRPSQRPNVEITTNQADVTCAKCLAAAPKLTLTIAEQMRAAHAAGDLDEVIRLAKAL